MQSYQLGDIVLIKFPFTNALGFKKRPALIIKDTHDNDIIVCRITSKIYESAFDIYLPEFKKFGLQLPSVIRLHKIATLEINMIDNTLGKLDAKTKKTVKIQLAKIVD
ncbi:MAG: hypothetical protein RL708_1240 [Bacteroidota bacterium]|jgi:mRNA interferase MazF